MLLKPAFEGPEDLWSFQLRLLALQQDVQAEISRLRGSRSYDLRDLEELRSALWEARRLGDAFAWLTFGLKKQLIVPLGANEPVPVPPDDDALLGFKTAVRGLASPELGFPVLHDITDCLRIGDITYVNPDGDPVTLEVKTRIEAAEPQAGGLTRKSFSVSFLGHGRNVTLPTRIRTEDGMDSALQHGLPPSAFRVRRAQRQVERMATAWDRQFAPEGLRGTDDPVLVMNVRAGSTDGTDELRRIVRLARRHGFAFAKVNHSEVVYAFYSESGVKESDLEAVDLSQVLIDSEILYLEPDMLSENSILITE